MFKGTSVGEVSVKTDDLLCGFQATAKQSIRLRNQTVPEICRCLRMLLEQVEAGWKTDYLKLKYNKDAP